MGKVLRIGWRYLDATVDHVPAGASWRRRLPETDDYEAVFGPVLDRLGADALVAVAGEPLADALQRRCRLARRPTVIATDDAARVADLYAELSGTEQV